MSFYLTENTASPLKDQLHNSVQGKPAGPDDHKEHMNTHCVQNEQIPMATEGGTHVAPGCDRLKREK
jgi:hypothetical protein